MALKADIRVLGAAVPAKHASDAGLGIDLGRLRASRARSEGFIGRLRAIVIAPMIASEVV